jgi:hypothetical protein
MSTVRTAARSSQLTAKQARIWQGQMEQQGQAGHSHPCVPEWQSADRAQLSSGAGSGVQAREQCLKQVPTQAGDYRRPVSPCHVPTSTCSSSNSCMCGTSRRAQSLPAAYTSAAPFQSVVITVHILHGFTRRVHTTEWPVNTTWRRRVANTQHQLGHAPGSLLQHKLIPPPHALPTPATCTGSDVGQGP